MIHIWCWPSHAPKTRHGHTAGQISPSSRCHVPRPRRLTDVLSDTPRHRNTRVDPKMYTVRATAFRRTSLHVSYGHLALSRTGAGARFKTLAERRWYAGRRTKQAPSDSSSMILLLSGKSTSRVPVWGRLLTESSHHTLHERNTLRVLKQRRGKDFTAL